MYCTVLCSGPTLLILLTLLYLLATTINVQVLHYSLTTLLTVQYCSALYNTILCTADHCIDHATPQLCTVLYNLKCTALYCAGPALNSTPLYITQHCTAQQYIAPYTQQHSISIASTAIKLHPLQTLPPF